MFLILYIVLRLSAQVDPDISTNNSDFTLSLIVRIQFVCKCRYVICRNKIYTKKWGADGSRQQKISEINSAKDLRSLSSMSLLT